MTRLGRWLVMGVVTVGSAALAQGAVSQDTGMGQDTSQQEATGGSGKTTTKKTESKTTTTEKAQTGDKGEMAAPKPAEKMEPKAGEKAEPGQGGSGTMSMMGNLPMPKDEQDLANHLHHVNQMEIQLAQLAEQKATSEEVKQYAKDMIKDHTQADQKLTDWAKKKNLTLAEVQPANDVAQKKMQAEQANRDLLQSLDGKPFEELYLSNQLAGHDMVLGLLTSAEQQFAKSDIVPLLKNLQPTIREHRDHAYRLLSAQKAPMHQARTPAPGR